MWLHGLQGQKNMVEMHQKMLQEEENMLQMLQKTLSKDVSIISIWIA